jgi:hypothetical protein
MFLQERIVMTALGIRLCHDTQAIEDKEGTESPMRKLKTMSSV